MRICPRCAELFPDDASYCPYDGGGLERRVDAYLGRTIAGRYRLVRRLGAGAMSSVYLARHMVIERLAAIKILRQDLAMNPNQRERFLREARAVNRLHHINVVEITDFGEIDSAAYLVMEFVEGRTLLEHLNGSAVARPLSAAGAASTKSPKAMTFPWSRAVDIAAQIASALGRVHQAGVIHRDLKPENIMLVEADGADLVKLMDFGIAKILDAPALTLTEQTFGTPGYIAPEHLEGIAIDQRADLYALGVVLYEMVTGALPFDARGASELLFKPLTSAPVSPSTRGAELPPELEALIMQTLSRRREQRPASAFALLDALSEVVRKHGRGAQARAAIDEANEVIRAASLGPTAAVTPDADPPFGESTGSVEPTISHEPRDFAPTIVDDVIPLATIPPPEEGAYAGRRRRRPTSEEVTAVFGKVAATKVAARWRGAVTELERTLLAAKEAGELGALDRIRAEELAESASRLVGGVERAAEKAKGAQDGVEALEVDAREFRANLGRAIDELVRDRGRLEERLVVLHEQRGAGRSAMTTTANYEDDAARIREERTIRDQLSDLTFQIGALEAQLRAKNEAYEVAWGEATSSLEGGLGALRQLTHELVRTLDAAAALLSATVS